MLTRLMCEKKEKRNFPDRRSSQAAFIGQSVGNCQPGGTHLSTAHCLRCHRQYTHKGPALP